MVFINCQYHDQCYIYVNSTLNIYNKKTQSAFKLIIAEAYGSLGYYLKCIGVVILFLYVANLLLLFVYRVDLLNGGLVVYFLLIIPFTFIYKGFHSDYLHDSLVYSFIVCTLQMYVQRMQIE